MTALLEPSCDPGPDFDPRAVIATDPSGVIRHLTPAAEALLGYAAGDLTGRCLRDLLVTDELHARAVALGLDDAGAEDDLEAVFAPVRTVGVPRERQRWTFLRRGTAPVQVLTTVSPVYTEDRVAGWALLLEVPEVPPPPLPPVGEEHGSRVSHELRTPISIILGYTEVLQSLDAGPLNPSQSQMLGKVEANARRLLELVQDLMRYYPAAALDVPMGPVPFDLVEVVEARIEGLAGELDAKRLRLAVDLGDGPMFVVGSPQHIAVMVDHLLSNAVKFTQEGGLVSVTLSSDADQFVLVVADSGCGIPPEDLQRVFTRFFRTPSVRAPHRFGQGLGLSTAQAIATMHGGRIEVSSCLGDGSDFVVRLPTAGSPGSTVLT